MATIATTFPSGLGERHDEHLIAARDQIDRLRAAGDTEALSKLERVYLNHAEYLRLYSLRQTAEQAFREADQAFRTFGDHSQDGYATNAARSRMLAASGLTIAPLTMLDTRRDPAELIQGASLFAQLAEAARG